MTRLFSLIVVFALVLAPVFAQKAHSDDELMDQVRIRLAGDIDVKGANIDVAVKDGVVTLKGKVENDKQRSRAEKLTKKVKGVKAVDNQLVIGPR
ncbi:MAG TPA: BON domain-containing protein [Bryobacteraceae bacterium]|nr:BON domain-containing protein [Bryobacteraceae bacterium]